jgi:hypothetical protein
LSRARAPHAGNGLLAPPFTAKDVKRGGEFIEELGRALALAVHAHVQAEARAAARDEAARSEAARSMKRRGRRRGRSNLAA